MSSFRYFTPGQADIVQQLRTQGQDICRHYISKKWLRASLDDFHFGFTHATPRAQIGRMKRGHAALHITSFILCKTMTKDDINIKLICARPNSHEGCLLLRQVEAYALEKGFKTISLFSLPEYKLVEWYTKQGFVLKAESRDPKSHELKTYYMEMTPTLKKEKVQNTS